MLLCRLARGCFWSLVGMSCFTRLLVLLWVVGRSGVVEALAVLIQLSPPFWYLEPNL